jgi:hypothetical protein
MNYRITKDGLLEVLSGWNTFIKKRVHLVACGGTALTLLDIKPSTKDIDLIVPYEHEHDYLVSILKDLGYKSASGWGFSRDDGFIFDLFRGNKVHTTELIEPILAKGNHMLVKEYSNIYLGVLNFYDIIISKLFRATSVDTEDCLMLIKAKKREINIDNLISRFRATASHDISEDKVNKNLDYFLRHARKEGVIK